MRVLPLLLALGIAAAPPSAAAGDDFAQASREVHRALAEKDQGALADALFALRAFDGEPAAKLLLSSAFRRDVPDFVLDAAVDAVALFQSEEAAAPFVAEAGRVREARRFAIFEALGRLKHASAEEALVAAAEDPDPRVRTAALRALADRDAPATAARAAAEHGSRDADPRVRSAAVAALAKWKALPGALPLLGRMAVERGRLFADAWQGLRRISGEELPPNPARWAAWWQTHPGEKEWKFEPPPLEPPTSWPVAGVRCWSRRVVFVLDISEGMADKPGYRGEDLVPEDVRKEGGRALEAWKSVQTRLDHARCHIERSIRALPEDARFEVVFGAETSGGVFGNLEPATPESKEKAIGRLRGLNGKQRQDFLRLLRTAFAGRFEADPLSPQAGEEGADTVVYFGTALPSWGLETDPVRIASTVRRWNRVRQVQFLGVGVGNHGGGLLLDLASSMPAGTAAAIQ
jgi:hypothetical protein